MFRSVVWIVFTSIAFTQCLPPKNRVPPLKLNNSIKTNLINGKLFRGVENSEKSIEDFKLNIKKINSNYIHKEQIFGKREDGDLYVAGLYEHNEFDNEKDVEVIASYPKAGLGNFIINYVEVTIFHNASDVNADISQGGISQHEVGIKITAKKTSIFRTYVLFYGVNRSEGLLQSSPSLKNPIKSINSNLANEHLSGDFKEFTFGKCTDYDSLIGTSDEYNEYGKDRDVEVNFGYPISGVGKFIVSCVVVQVEVFQNANNVRAEVSQGGINQQEIGIKVTAEKTSCIDIATLYYGFKQ